jgi:Fe-S-cluster-containing hydrogenase component 2
MRVCPTKAIRVKRGLARISDERCIDCGECLRVCPHAALLAVTTTSADLGRFRYKIALPSPVLYSQFGQHVMPDEILGALKEIGFDSVYDEALICEMASMAIEEYLDEHKTPRPMIGSTCPVVVRLVQRLFPDLCSLIIPLEPPREIAAKRLREEISRQQGISPEEIGIIHITPCPAKLVSINRPETMKRSHLDGAISIQEIYHPLMMRLKRKSPSLIMQTTSPVSGTGVAWAMSGGEISGMKYFHSVAVSGVQDSIRIFEDVESGKLKDIEYLECLICPDGCIGGPLTVENRFLAKSNVHRLIRVYGGQKRVDRYSVRSLYGTGFFSFERGVEPKPFAPLDESRLRAIEKLQAKEETLERLPGTDCGVCGAPDCATFAEDVARGEMRPSECRFLKTAGNGGGQHA